MSWRKHFKPVNSVLPAQDRAASGYTQSVDSFNSWLPDVYMGPPDRMQRYVQYEQMDMDHEVNAAMDTLGEFCTQKSDTTGTPFEFEFNEQPTPAEMLILERALKQWNALNEFNKRMFRIFRSTLMYGDQFFIRDPETFKLFWVDPNKVEKVVVNESDGKALETYFMKDMDLNLQSLCATAMAGQNKGGFANVSAAFPQGSLGNQSSQAGGVSSANYTSQSGLPTDNQAFPVAAQHVVHLSMTEGLDGAWPFGISVLEPIFKIYKQKSLLEDAMLIYRIHRAPERRVFFIDVGNMPPAKAQQYLERVRYEVQQKRIPSKSGGGSQVTDAAYNPLSTLEDYFFAQTADGRGSKVDVLPGGSALGDINDMLYFNNKMFRALGIPSSYLPTGPEDGSATSSDGKVGSAFIQEFRFTEKCKRHQRQLVQVLDKEFKLFLKERGITLDNSTFNLSFTPPQNFSEYKKIELDSARLSVFGQIAEVPFVAKQYALKRYLGWSDEELLENERLWKAENAVPTGPKNDDDASLSNVGISSSDMTDIGSDDFSDSEYEEVDAGAEASDDEVDAFGSS